jgi:hypothetical protein
MIVLIIYLIMALPLPAEAPLHFSFGGEPDRYGSPWEVFGLLIGLSLFFILLSVLLDELWARQEKTKTFNWLSLLDEIVVGSMTGISIGYLAFLDNGASLFDFPWRYFAPMFVSVIALALILEAVRPYNTYRGEIVAKESQVIRAELEQHLKGSRFVFWDHQNPRYVEILTTLLPLVMLVVAVLYWFSQPWMSLLYLIISVILIIPHGGQRTLVTRSEITIRWGIPGIRVLRLPLSEIAAVEMHEFSPLRDFGGYGIRFNREMKAYYLRGTRGVVLTMTGGKRYLIGSDNPEQLLTVLQIVTGK